MAESEAQAVRFTIDHYEPRNARPDLVNDYNNLMYACGECNLRKGDRSPPPEARADGVRFFRADQDHRREHFRSNGGLVDALTRTGDYSIKALDLNRAMLRRLRNLRERLAVCDEFVAEGILALRRVRIDQLPKPTRVNVIRYREQAIAAEAVLAGYIDSLLRKQARSALLDTGPDPEEEARRKERLANLREQEALYPGKWRAPRRGHGGYRKTADSHS
jgi:hypothetical protein